MHPGWQCNLAAGNLPDSVLWPLAAAKPLQTVGLPEASAGNLMAHCAGLHQMQAFAG